MKLALASLRTLFFFLVAASTATGKPVLEEECAPAKVSLGIDPRDNLAAETTVDIYECGDKVTPSLVVFVCGGGVPKSAYSTFAAGLSAKNGYAVAVIEHLVQFGPFSPPLNFGTPVDIENTIAYAETNLDVDMSSIILMGHSFGGGMVMSALSNECIFPLCKDPALPFPPPGGKSLSHAIQESSWVPRMGSVSTIVSTVRRPSLL